VAGLTENGGAMGLGIWRKRIQEKREIVIEKEER
jgi:hypothetical protein